MVTRYSKDMKGKVCRPTSQFAIIAIQVSLSTNGANSISRIHYL